MTSQYKTRLNVTYTHVQIPTKKQDIVKHVLKEHARLLPSVLEGARKYLKQTFDYSVCEVDHNKNKYYILRNNIVLPELQQLTRPTHALSQVLPVSCSLVLYVRLIRFQICTTYYVLDIYTTATYTCYMIILNIARFTV